MSFSFVKVSREDAVSLLVDGYEFLYMDVAQGEFTADYLASDVAEYFNLYADMDADFVPGIYSDGERLDSLEDENYFGVDVYVHINGCPKKMTRNLYNEYLDASADARRDAEHDARGTANATVGIFRPSY
jgi:hypothetical protein